MSYVINVTLQGNRFFSTSRGSCKTQEQLTTVLSSLQQRFTEADGFKITVFAIESNAHELDINDIAGSLASFGIDG